MHYSSVEESLVVIDGVVVLHADNIRDVVLSLNTTLVTEPTFSNLFDILTL